MHKTLLGAGGAIVLLLGAVSASASAAPTPVDGDHFGRSGLTYASQQCTDYTVHPATEPKVLIKRGPGTPPMGSQSLGWDMQGQTTYGAGVLAHVPDPKTLKTASIKTFLGGGSGQGSAYAIYHAPNEPGVWKGTAPLPLDSTAGWHRVNVGKVEFKWHYTGDSGSGGDTTSSLQALAAQHGGNGKGAEIGVLFGCAGETFYVDDFEIASRKVHHTYDLGGYRSVSDILWGPLIHKKITITYGQRLGLTSRLRARYDFTKLTGKTHIDAKRSGAKKWSTFDSVPAGNDFKVSPARTTSYRSLYEGNEKYRQSDWKTLLVRVRSVVKAGLADATVTRGHSFTAAGRVLPGRSATLQLQRYANKHWHTIKKGKSGKDGRFRLSLVAGSTGTSFWRVVATGGGGNLENHSRQMKLVVSAPHHSGGGTSGGTSGGSTPPPDPPPPPTEPPPPTH
jgi:hypothetical protein